MTTDEASARWNSIGWIYCHDIIPENMWHHRSDYLREEGFIYQFDVESTTAECSMMLLDTLMESGETFGKFVTFASLDTRGLTFVFRDEQAAIKARLLIG